MNQANDTDKKNVKNKVSYKEYFIKHFGAFLISGVAGAIAAAIVIKPVFFSSLPKVHANDYVCVCKVRGGGDDPSNYYGPFPLKGPLGKCPHINHTNNWWCD